MLIRRMPGWPRVREPPQELVELYVRLAKKARSLLEVPHARSPEELGGGHRGQTLVSRGWYVLLTASRGVLLVRSSEGIQPGVLPHRGKLLGEIFSLLHWGPRPPRSGGASRRPRRCASCNGRSATCGRQPQPS